MFELDDEWKIFLKFSLFKEMFLANTFSSNQGGNQEHFFNH